MELLELRKTLLGNITQMCEYAERTLRGTCRNFNHQYEHGFIYGYSSYHISFDYSPKKGEASVNIHFYGTGYRIRDNKIIEHSSSKNEDITNDYTTSLSGVSLEHVQKALEITQQRWYEIKSAMEAAKNEEQNIVNFTI